MTTIYLLMRSLRLASLIALLTLCAGQSARVEAAQPGTVDLSATPPDLTTSVDPNIIVTFDDSGSMASHFMGDNRPFDNAGWGAPWGCAATINNSVTAATDVRSKPMNGVYYNPNIVYTPPKYEDGTSFPNADATLAAVWADGVAVNRPLLPATPAAAANNGNPNSATNGSDTKTTFINGKKVGGTDKRWTCGYGSYPTAFSDASNVLNGGPYFYRYKGPTIPVDTFGTPTGPVATAGTGLNLLYNAANWEAVPVPVGQWQNFANWYAYYRTRNLMTRTALSRVFAQFGDNIRVAWQNIAPYVGGGLPAVKINASTIITNLNNTNASAPNYRKNFYDWIFSTQATSNTPDRAATIGAGEFFRRGNTGDLKDPYWEPAKGSLPAGELSCRQNFHMLVTDGYWNEGNPTAPTGFFGVKTPPANLPDGTPFSGTAAQSRVFWDVPVSTTGGCGSDGSIDCYPSLADIAFFYWANDLRGDLPQTVPPYLPNKTIGVTGSPTASIVPPISNTEIYYNPDNDPASWQHVVQFMVTLGVSGKLQYAADPACLTTSTSDICKLRRGDANSTSVTGWPMPARNNPAAIDDTWHAAVNSRGSYFSAGDPTALVTHLTDIISSILVRSTSTSQPTLSMSIATSNGASFSAGYDSSDWSGNVMRQIPFDANGNPITPPTKVWEAGCLLTGGNCIGGVKPPRSPASRVVLTFDGSTGRPFEWGSLSSAQQAALNRSPVSVAASANPSTWIADGFGSKRVDYLRGDRTYEATGSPQFRHRGSVLGAVVNAQPVYISSPDSGWSDNFPAGSPEAVAAANTSAAGNSGSYAKFVNHNNNRAATVYVGANDGMLHAFSAADGVERWAYVPGMTFNYVSSDSTPFTKSNVNLLRYTNKSTLVPTVNNSPTKQDVFINGEWHTVLVGSLGLGGRGVYALDVTDPTSVTESSVSAASTVMWEFTNNSTNGAALGYTYGKPNIVRLHTGKWAVLVASGYFPLEHTRSLEPNYDDPASNDVAAGKTSLLVLDLVTGALITELKTSSAPQYGQATKTFGLSTPGVYDIGGDQVDDVALAGDLAGNVWRFDLSDPSPGSWKVDLLFKTYAVAADVGKYPVSVMPLGMRVPATRGIVWVFGTGKYIGKDDRTASIPSQAFYGVYDAGTNPAGSTYPVPASSLLVQAMTEDTHTPPNRFVTTAVPTITTRGWTIPLNISTEPGERNVVTGFALDTSNRVILPTLIPTSDDPCNPGRRGALIVVDAASGGAGAGIGAGNGSSGTLGSGIRVGVVDTSGAIPVIGELSPYVPVGGGVISVLGIPLGVPDNYWHRGAWRELLDLL